MRETRFVDACQKARKDRAEDRHIICSGINFGHRNGVNVVECFQNRSAAVIAFWTKEKLSYADRVFKRVRCRGSWLSLFDPFHTRIPISRVR